MCGDQYALLRVRSGRLPLETLRPEVPYAPVAQRPIHAVFGALGFVRFGIRGVRSAVERSRRLSLFLFGF